MAMRVSYKPTGLKKPNTPLVPNAPATPKPMAVKPPTAPSLLPNDRPAPKVKYNPTKPPMEARGPLAPILPQDKQAPKPPVPRPTTPPKRVPIDPAKDKGTIPPPTRMPIKPKPINKIRRRETPQERIARLKAMQKAGNKKVGTRIDELKGRIKSGDLDKNKAFKKQQTPTPPKRVQLDDKPDTWPDADHKRRNRNESEALAELALPRGMDTIFYDNPEGDAQNKTAVKQKQQLRRDNKESANTPAIVPENNNNTRGDENLAQRRKRLQDKLAKLKPGDPRIAQLKARIADLEKRINKGDTKGRNKNQPGTKQRPYRNREVSYRPLIPAGTLRI